MSVLRIITRNSPLALWQAHTVRSALERQYTSLEIRVMGITTEADRFLEKPLLEIGGKALFVKELEQALYNGDADIAVHSMKDVPVELPEGLLLGAVCLRANPSDAFVARDGRSILGDLPEGALIGTSSVRRQSQTAVSYPQLHIVPLRGNVQTRLHAMEERGLAGIILATAALERLGLAAYITQRLSLRYHVPAPGQGALGIECRSGDTWVQKLIAVLDDPTTHLCVRAERTIGRLLGGSCRFPIGAYGEMQGDQMCLQSFVGSLDGSIVCFSRCVGAMDQPEVLAERVVEDLLAQGAGALLSQVP